MEKGIRDFRITTSRVKITTTSSPKTNKRLPKPNTTVQKWTSAMENGKKGVLKPPVNVV